MNRAPSLKKQPEPTDNVTLLKTFGYANLLKFFLDESTNEQEQEQTPSSTLPISYSSSTINLSSSSSSTPNNPLSTNSGSSYSIPSPSSSIPSSSQTALLYSLLPTSSLLNQGFINQDDLLIIHQILAKNLAKLNVDIVSDREDLETLKQQSMSQPSSSSSAPNYTTSNAYATAKKLYDIKVAEKNKKEKVLGNLRSFIQNTSRPSSTGELSLTNPPTIDMLTLSAFSEKLVGIFYCDKTLNFFDKFFIDAITSNQHLVRSFTVEHQRKILDEAMTIFVDIFANHIDRLLFTSITPTHKNFHDATSSIIKNTEITNKTLATEILYSYALLLRSKNYCHKAREEEQYCPSSSKVTEVKTVYPDNMTALAIKEQQEQGSAQQVEKLLRLQKKRIASITVAKIETHYMDMALYLRTLAPGVITIHNFVIILADALKNMPAELQYLNQFFKDIPPSKCLIEALGDFIKTIYITTLPSSSQQNDVNWTIDQIFIKNLMLFISEKLSPPLDSPTLTATTTATLPLSEEASISSRASCASSSISSTASGKSTPPRLTTTTSSLSEINMTLFATSVTPASNPSSSSILNVDTFRPLATSTPLPLPTQSPSIIPTTPLPYDILLARFKALSPTINPSSKSPLPTPFQLRTILPITIETSGINSTKKDPPVIAFFKNIKKLLTPAQKKSLVPHPDHQSEVKTAPLHP